MVLLGERIKAERKKINLSQNKLAEMVEVSPSFLSQVEKGKNEPSLSTLKKIAGCLDVTVSYLLGEEENIRKNLVKKNSRHKLVNFWDGLSIEFLASIDKKNVMEACIHEVYFNKDNMTNQVSPYSHEGQEFIFVIDGEITLIVDEKEMHLEAGDAYYLSDCTKKHYFYKYNSDDVSAKVMCVTTPPYFYSYNK